MMDVRFTRQQNMNVYNPIEAWLHKGYNSVSFMTLVHHHPVITSHKIYANYVMRS